MEPKKEEYSFYQDRKVTCWERTHFTVKAESYEKAVEFLQAHRTDDIIIIEDDDTVRVTDGETLYETSESLSPQDNAGCATIEVFNNSGEEITNNGNNL